MYWVPPILTPLITAVRATTLKRLHPFTSHATLRLRTTQDWHINGKVAPACISLHPAGHYVVYSGQLLTTNLVQIRATPDPQRAATELEQLLTHWP